MPSKHHKNVCQPSVYSNLFEKYSTELSRLFYYKYGTLSNCEDKVQEAFVKLWENCSKVTPQAAWSFLYKVINNSLLNEFKHRKVVLKYQQVSQRDYSNETPEYILRKKEFMELYERALANMPEEFREAFMLNKVGDKTHKEVAEMLGVTKKVAEYRIYSALKHLRKHLGNIKIN